MGNFKANYSGLNLLKQQQQQEQKLKSKTGHTHAICDPFSQNGT